MEPKLAYTMLEEGFDAAIDEYGRLHILTNTPTGHIKQELILSKQVAVSLRRYLNGD